MALDWDNLLISVVDPDTFLVTEDELIFRLDAEQRMIVFTGERGADGKDGADGDSIHPVGAWSAIEKYNHLDVVTHGGSSFMAIQDVPAGVSTANPAYWMLLAERGPQGEQGERGPAGYGAIWGDIGGTLSDQTDVQDALDAKANTADLGALAAKDTVDYDTDITNLPTLGTMSSVDDATSDNKVYARKDGGWYDLDGRYYTESEMDTALANKSNLTIVAPAFSTSTAYVVGDYVVYQGGLYRFTSAHSAGAWNSSHVSAVNVGDELEGRVKKSGDTMSGNLTITRAGETNYNGKNTNITRGTAPSAWTWIGSNVYYDSVDNLLGYTGVAYTNYRSSVVRILARNRYNDADVNNTLDLYVNNDGKKTVWVNGAEDEWCSGIGAVRKTGDTMSGNLTTTGAMLLDESNLYLDTDNIEASGAGPVSGEVGGNNIVFRDKNNTWIGAIHCEQRASGNGIQLELYAHRYVNGDIYNILDLGVSADGTRYVDISASAWRTAMNNIMYYASQAVSALTNAVIMRIPASGTDIRITTDTVLLDCQFDNEYSIRSNLSCESYAGYVEITGTCTKATVANVLLGNKAN